jgi:hypothetical protein
MNLPPEVMAKWPQALANYGHPWKPGQQCVHSDDYLGDYCPQHDTNRPHDIPMPAVTDELLWQMLVKGLERNPWFIMRVDDFVFGEEGDRKIENMVRPLAAAVILAWASME